MAARLDVFCANGPPIDRSDFARVLTNMNAESIVLGVFLILGSVISVIPQHIKIWQNRSSDGLSYLWIFFSQINQFAGVMNAIVLKFPQEMACSVLGFGRCLPSLLSMFQLGLLWVFTFPIYIWFLKFADPYAMGARDWFFARFSFCLFLVYACVLSVTATILINFYGECSDPVIYFGSGLGIVCTVVTLVQYTPQIFSTFKRKSAGSLSLLMLCIQAPGSFIIVVYMIFITRDSPTTWFSFFVSGCQQVILIIMLIYYSRFYKRKAVVLANLVSAEEAAGSTDSLLANEGE